MGEVFLSSARPLGGGRRSCSAAAAAVIAPSAAPAHTSAAWWRWSVTREAEEAAASSSAASWSQARHSPAQLATSRRWRWTCAGTPVMVTGQGRAYDEEHRGEAGDLGVAGREGLHGVEHLALVLRRHLAVGDVVLDIAAAGNIIISCSSPSCSSPFVAAAVHGLPVRPAGGYEVRPGHRGQGLDHEVDTHGPGEAQEEPAAGEA